MNRFGNDWPMPGHDPKILGYLDLITRQYLNDVGI